MRLTLMCKILIKWCSSLDALQTSQRIKTLESARAALGALGRWDRSPVPTHTVTPVARGDGYRSPPRSAACRRMHVREICILFDRLSGGVGHVYVCVGRYESRHYESRHYKSRHYESRAMTASNVRMSGGPIG